MITKHCTKYRKFSLTLLLALMVLMLAVLAKRGIEADPMALFPQKSESMQLTNKYPDLTVQKKLMGAVILEVKHGDIYTVETFEKIDRITNKLVAMAGLSSSGIKSLTNGGAKFTSNSSEGMFTYGVVYDGLPKTAKALEVVRNRIESAPMIKGLYVADDNKSVSFVVDMLKGADPKKLYNDLNKLKIEEENQNYALYFIGVPAIAGQFANQMPRVALALAISFLLVLGYAVYRFRTPRGALVPVAAFFFQIIVTLGLAATVSSKMHVLFLFPVLLLGAAATLLAIFSKSARFNVQARQADVSSCEAINIVVNNMMLPLLCVVALMVAVGGIFVISSVGAILSLGVILICGAVALFINTTILTPILLSYGKKPSEANVCRINEDGFCGRIAERIAVKSLPMQWAIIVVMAVLLLTGLYGATKIASGGSEFGSAFFDRLHNYNKGFDLFNKHFIGFNELAVAVASKNPAGLKNKADLLKMEQVLAEIEQSTDAKKTLSMPGMIRMMGTTLREGNPRWSTIPEEERDIMNLGGMVLLAPEARSLMSDDWSHALLRVYYPDNDPIRTEQRVEQLQKIATKYSDARISFQAGAGYLGQQWGANRSTRQFMLIASILSLGLVFLIGAIATRSMARGGQLVLPLAATQAAAWLVMSLLGIPANVFMAPIGPFVAALAGGFGMLLLLLGEEERIRKHIFRKSLLLLLFTVPWWFAGLTYMGKIMAVFTGSMYFVDILLLMIVLPRRNNTDLDQALNM